MAGTRVRNTVFERERDARRTDITLPEVISLPLGGLIPWKLPVYFVFDVAHGDEGDDDAGPVTSIHFLRFVRTVE